MKCLVLGGGGFVGSSVADRLLKDGHQLRIFERAGVQPYRVFGSDEHVEWYQGDFLDLGSVTDALKGIDTVIHLVSTTLPKSSNDDPIYDVQSNLVGSLQLLEAMRSNDVARIVFISSGGTVYGRPIELPIKETHPTNPEVSYGITKLAIEKYLLLYQKNYDIRSTILRVSNPYGQRQRTESAQGAVGIFLARAIKNEPIDIWGDGSVTRDYVHIGDVADAFSCALEYDGNESVFNIGSGRGVSLNELVATLELVLGRTITKNYFPARQFDLPVNTICCALAEQELGWSPKTDLKDGIALTVDGLDVAG